MRFLHRCIQLRRKFLQEEKLVFAVQQNYRKILQSIGKPQRVEEKSRNTLRLLKKFQHTKLYYLVKEDTERLKKAIQTVRANPKKHKLKYMLASVYIISPGTFELTGMYLFMRYLWKYMKR